jgi:hypothetical protein
MNELIISCASTDCPVIGSSRERIFSASRLNGPFVLWVILNSFVLSAQESVAYDTLQVKYCAYFVESGMFRGPVSSDPFDLAYDILDEATDDKVCDTIDYRSSSAIDHIATLHLADSSRKRRFFLLVDMNSLRWAKPIRVVVYHDLTVAVNRGRVSDDVTQIIEWIVTLFPPSAQIRLREIIADPEK